MIYKGILDEDEYGCLTCDGLHIIDLIFYSFNPGDKVLINYFISDKEVTEEQAKEALILKTIGGIIEQLDFVLNAYSEFTIVEINESLVINGHDLEEELRENLYKYLILKIELVN